MSLGILGENAHDGTPLNPAAPVGLSIIGPRGSDLDLMLVARRFAEAAGLRVTVYHSVATALWGSLGIAGADASVIQGWGGLFGLPAPA